MSREWKPGDVAVVHSVNDEDHRAVRRGGVWIKLDAEGYIIDHYAESVRPLVVIDPEDREAVERLADLFFAALYPEMKNTPGHDDLTAMQAALREFTNPTPPKPDEPQGLGAVVEDEHGNRWIRTDPEAPGWTEWDAPVTRTPYARIAAVRILSPGVAS
jgi:hypothetical protein